MSTYFEKNCNDLFLIPPSELDYTAFSGRFLTYNVKESFVERCIVSNRYDILATVFWHLSIVHQDDENIILQVLDYRPDIFLYKQNFWSNRLMIMKCVFDIATYFSFFSHLHDDTEFIEIAITTHLYVLQYSSDLTILKALKRTNNAIIYLKDEELRQNILNEAQAQLTIMNEKIECGKMTLDEKTVIYESINAHAYSLLLLRQYMSNKIFNSIKSRDTVFHFL